MAKKGGAAANPKGGETYDFDWGRFCSALACGESGEGQTSREIVTATGHAIGWVRERLRAGIQAGYVSRTTVCRASELDGKQYQVSGFVLTPAGAKLLEAAG